MSFRSILVLVLVSGLLVVSPRLQAQDTDTKQADTKQADTNLAKYFTVETRKLSKACLADIRSSADWNQKKSVLRAQLFEMLGLAPLPKKTDLKVVYTGTVEHDDFVVKKLHYQSRPGLFVTGNLYLPKGTSDRLPAILYVCGHGRVAKNGISYGNKVHYHHHGSWFARNGYVCLTIDTLQLGEIEGIHHGTYREKMWWWLNRGYTPAGVEAWNCIRALDLLQSLPEVDGDRLGVTGRSGGGAYSWWIAALDERIKCAVPVAGITDLENHVVDGCVEGHCDCMFMVNTYRWDYPMVAALVAPRPLLISNTDDDGIFPLDGVYRTFKQVKRVYALQGAGKNVGLHITKGPHKDTQELRVHAFRWFNHYLKKDDSLIYKPAEKYFEPEQLKVFEKLPLQQINTRIHESFVPVAKIDLPENESNWKKTAARLKQAVREKCFRGLPVHEDDLKIKIGETKAGNSNAAKTLAIQITPVNFESQQHVPLAMTVLHRGSLKSIEQFRVLIVGEEDAADFGNLSKATPRDLESAILKRMSAIGGQAVKSVASLLDAKEKGIVILTPRGIGTNQWNPNERFQTQARRRFYLLGQTADGMRVYDIVRAAEALRELTDGQPRILFNAKRKMAVNAVYAAILDGEIAGLELLEPTTTHRDGPYFLNVRRVLDVPQAIAVAARDSSIQIRTKQPEAFDFAAKASRLGGSLGINQ